MEWYRTKRLENGAKINNVLHTTFTVRNPVHMTAIVRQDHSLTNAPLCQSFSERHKNKTSCFLTLQRIKYISAGYKPNGLTIRLDKRYKTITYVIAFFTQNIIWINYSRALKKTSQMITETITISLLVWKFLYIILVHFQLEIAKIHRWHVMFRQQNIKLCYMWIFRSY